MKSINVADEALVQLVLHAPAFCLSQLSEGVDDDAKEKVEEDSTYI